MGLGLRVMAFSERLAKWEPLLEPWKVELQWRASSSNCLVVPSDATASPTSPTAAPTPSTDTTALMGTGPEATSLRPARVVDAAAPARPVVSHAVKLHSAEPLELNVSHAMLSSALQAALILLKQGEETGESTKYALVKRHHTSCVHNLTELPLSYEVGVAGRVQPTQGVEPGELRSFPTPKQPKRRRRSTTSGTMSAHPPPSVAGGSIYTTDAVAASVSAAHAAACANCPELVAAVRSGNAVLAAELLRRTAPVESTDLHGVPALHHAILRRDKPMVALLLRAGAGVDSAAPVTGNRPLHLAARRNALECTQALLEARANPAATNARGEVPARVARPKSEVQKVIYKAMQERIQVERRAGIGRGFSSVRLGRAAAGCLGFPRHH